MKAFFAALAVCALAADAAYAPERVRAESFHEYKPASLPVTDAYKAAVRNGYAFFASFPWGCTGADPCVITQAQGGKVREHHLAAIEVLAGYKQTVVLAGPCASACVLFADVARDKVCITPTASLHFHKYYNETKWGRRFGHRDPPHSADIDRWVRKKGGYPTDTFLVMRYRDAKSIWRTCELNPPLPKPDPRRH